MSTRLESLGSKLYTRVSADAAAAVLGGTAVIDHATFDGWAIIGGERLAKYIWDADESVASRTEA
jgi:hypothetical protein